VVSDVSEQCFQKQYENSLNGQYALMKVIVYYYIIFCNKKIQDLFWHLGCSGMTCPLLTPAIDKCPMLIQNWKVATVPQNNSQNNSQNKTQSWT